MELLKLSKFKFQLQALIAEARHRKEKENSATEQIHLLIQKQKKTEEEYSRQLQELQVELASSYELRQKLDRKVSYLQNDNVLLENKQKELKETINRLLQSRENFLNAYEESTCDMKRAIEARDRKLTALYEKINSHLTLFDSIEKEAFSIKKVVDNVERVVSEKEELVASLRIKMDKVSAFENVYVERIHHLESKLKNDEDEFRRKNKIISELEAQLEGAKISNSCHTQIEELQKTLSAKDVVIKNLISEKEALHSELGNLGIVLRRIQDAVAAMNQEDKNVFYTVLRLKEKCDDMATVNADNRVEGANHNGGERSPTKTSSVAAPENRASPLSQEHKAVGSQLRKNNHSSSCVSDLAGSPPELASSEHQSAYNVLSISANDGKDNCAVIVHHLVSECSITQAETSKNPG
ncbi:protein CROWDED NUCLEI 2 isoform X1 [Melia azedarach]|uniref:Protein CROWDED NUCLEI 2 isoform X1 n=1 Tax=Melia azedarach TaxID=155640 RepID=A0ACC1XKK7_MELAZ|nr:protein CROWDED NUCLEI 2 isoform X1 [Melia azedarach]